jgi:hypothetical protein
MEKDAFTLLLEKLAAEARAGGLVVRCEEHGVLGIVHPRHGPKVEQGGLPLDGKPG